jgi:anti-sigma factor RsiW
MDCKTTRILYGDAHHARLSPDVQKQRATHLQDCAPCRVAEQDEQTLTDALERRLPRYPATRALRRQLEDRWLPRRASTVHRRWLVPMLATFASGAAVVTALLVGWSLARREGGRPSVVLAEAINDHLRFLEGETPLQVLTSDLHQVKPWFAGKLDFAPPVAFRGDNDYPLLGGEVSRFLEQRAARFVFARRLHKISLFVLPIRGLPEAGHDVARVGAPAATSTSRGFSVVAWQSGEFAYILVSDVSPAELLELGRRISATP